MADLVVQRDWAALIDRGLTEPPFTLEMLSHGVAEQMDLYPGTFVRIPDSDIEACEVEPDRRLGRATDGSRYYGVVLPFHTAEGGRTDLDMMLHVYEDGPAVRVRLDDVLVR